MNWEEPDELDMRVLGRQLGRPPRGRVLVASRCPFGRVQVAVTAPILDDGTPFPTLYWLTCPVLRSEVGRLEAGDMRERLREMLRDEVVSRRLEEAERRYVRERKEVAASLGMDGAEELWEGRGGVGGGKSGSLKCLHSHYAHFLAGGDNPVGEAVHGELEGVQSRSCGGDCP